MLYKVNIMKIETVNDLCVEKFLMMYNKDNCSRLRSFDHVHEEFEKNMYNRNVSDEYLALHLFAFLASWGMLRGSSYMLQKDYLFLVPIVRIIRNEKYKQLLDVSYAELNQEYIALVLQIKKEIIQELVKKKYYKMDNQKENKPSTINVVSDTLIGKILLATFSCIPAYDRYIVTCMKSLGIQSSINENGLNSLITFINNNVEFFKEKEEYINNRLKSKRPYSLMKVIDMLFWESGYYEESSKNDT